MLLTLISDVLLNYRDAFKQKQQVNKLLLRRSLYLYNVITLIYKYDTCIITKLWFCSLSLLIYVSYLRNDELMIYSTGLISVVVD